MTLLFPDKYASTVRSPEQRELVNTGAIEVSQVRPGIGTQEPQVTNPELLKELIELRTDFVVKIGWFDKYDAAGNEFMDGDRYDEDPHTLHVAYRSPDDGEIKAALRLTQVDSLRDSLSWSMLSRNEHANSDASNMMQTIERGAAENGENYMLDLTSAASRGELQDLTRLVSPLGPDTNLREVKDAMLEAFAYSLATTTPNLAGDPRWIFLTTESLKGMLDYMGIQNVVLSHGKVSEGDAEDSYFCMVKPVEAIHAILDEKENPKPRVQARLSAGLAKAAMRAAA